ncbi:UDP-N-acetylglucosamine 2-epimerase (non-hydrolyzing) [Thermomonas brevis]|uniref:UDP-N-acetylglucosamine 2-epimerase n=1 Tax=Thermomonas brevis TaxID=215691 RepID=A0A7G9QXK5_9GAMM|nr:UDP-N-acetylglucosamine 2-epimerase (non-hydrolyzing) [Thermomonas brevis]
MLRALFVFGTRPEAIKLAPLYLALAEDPRFEARLCVTGQHREMLDQVLALFGMIPDYDLSVMRDGQGLMELGSSILAGMEGVIRDCEPDVLLVHGDTTTTLLGALAGYYARIPIAHVEAGLRSGDPYSPWPEEGNRRAVGSLAKFHFAPTPGARDNLLREGIGGSDVFVTGNTVIDALLEVRSRIASNVEIQRNLDARFAFLSGYEKLVLVTGHRRENFGPGFEGICRGIARIAAEFPRVGVVYPVHLNPSVRKPVMSTLAGKSNIHLIEPLDYAAFVRLMDKCALVLTDSGGIQEEAPSLGKPVLVMRDTTERPEALQAGTAKLVGTDEQRIAEAVGLLLTDEKEFSRMSHGANPYGDGLASIRIRDVLLSMRKR